MTINFFASVATDMNSLPGLSVFVDNFDFGPVPNDHKSATDNKLIWKVDNTLTIVFQGQIAHTGDNIINEGNSHITAVIVEVNGASSWSMTNFPSITLSQLGQINNLSAFLSDKTNVNGSSGADVLDGFGGNDHLKGGAGNDHLNGG